MKNGWTGISHIRKAYGFEVGTYDVYLRVRAEDGTGTLNFGVYNVSTTSYPMSGKVISGLTTSYQAKYVGRFTLSEININSNHDIWSYFSGNSIYKFVDFIEYRKVD